MNVMTATDVGGLVRANNEDACGGWVRTTSLFAMAWAGILPAKLPPVWRCRRCRNSVCGKESLGGEVRLAIESAQRHILSAAAEIRLTTEWGQPLPSLPAAPCGRGGAQLTLGAMWVTAGGDMFIAARRCTNSLRITL